MRPDPDPEPAPPRLPVSAAASENARRLARSVQTRADREARLPDPEAFAAALREDAGRGGE